MILSKMKIMLETVNLDDGKEMNVDSVSKNR